MIVAGRVAMSRDPSAEARRLLQLRYDLAARTAESLRAAGFTAVHADIILGEALRRYVAAAQPGSLRVVVLVPDAATIAQRERGRAKTAYGRYRRPTKSLEDAIQQHLAWLDETPPLGLRVDSAGQTVDETVEEILRRWDEARVG